MLPSEIIALAESLLNIVLNLVGIDKARDLLDASAIARAEAIANIAEEAKLQGKD